MSELLEIAREQIESPVCDQAPARGEVVQGSDQAGCVRPAAPNRLKAEVPVNFWGQLGLRLSGQSDSNWYPVSADAADAVREQLAAGYDIPEWMIVEALNNRVIVFRPKQMQRVFLVNDASDWPQEDRRGAYCWDAECGLPLDVYKAMAEWANEKLGCGTDFKSLPARLRRSALSNLKKGGFVARPAALQAKLHHTTAHFTDGTNSTYEIDRQNLVAIWSELEGNGGPEFIEMSSADGDFETFFPVRKLSMIDMSRIELEAGRQDFDNELREQTS